MSTRHPRSVLLLVALLAAGLVGCGASGGESSAADPTDAPPTTAAADPGTDPEPDDPGDDEGDDDGASGPGEPEDDQTDAGDDGDDGASPGRPSTDDIVDTNYTDVLEVPEAGLALAVPPTYLLWPVADGIACVSPTDYADYEFCDGIEIRWGDALDTATQGNPYDPTKGDFAWYAGGDVPLCSPVWDDTSLVTESVRSSYGTRDIGGVEATFDSWALTCDNGGDVEVFQWYLADADLLFTNRGGSIMNPIVAEHIALA